MRATFKLIYIFLLFPLLANSQTKQEISAWENAKGTNTFVAYLSFINTYPESKFKAELEMNLFNLIHSFPDVKYVLYPDFRLRDKPNASGILIKKLPKNQELKVMEKSATKDEITIDNFIAKDYWYRVELNKDTAGWVFGAGLITSDDFFNACKLFIEKYPASKNMIKVKELFLKTDCNYWQLVKKEDSKLSYAGYLKYFPTGIYSDDATLLNKYIDTVSCFKFVQGKEYMNVTVSVKINISVKEVRGTLSTELVEFSSAEGKLTGKRNGKMLVLQDEVENSDSDEIVVQEEVYLLCKEGLQQMKPGKNLLLKLDCN